MAAVMSEPMAKGSSMLGFIQLFERAEVDDEDHDESGALPTKRCPIISPSGERKETWDIVILVLIVYSAITVPVRVGFSAGAEGLLWVLEVGMSLVFMTDLVLSFFTSYLDTTDGLWVKDHAKIAKNYLSGWFWIDAPSSVPVELIEYFAASGEQGGLAVLRVLRMFRLFRLLRLLKMDMYITKLEDHLAVNLRPLQLIFLVFKMLFTAHMLGCGWFFVAMIPPEGEPTWITEHHLAGEVDLQHKYLLSVYWALTTLTTVGYGDIVPISDIEHKYAIFALLFGAIIFADLLGNVASLIATLDRQAALVSEKMDQVKEYLRWRQIPRELGIRVRRYYEHFYMSMPVFDEAAILGDLNPELNREVVSCIALETFRKVPVFMRFSPAFRLEIFRHLKPLTVDAGDTIHRKGELSEDLLFLMEGEISELSEIDDKTPVKRIRPNEEAVLNAFEEEIAVKESVGCVGQTTFLGRRRTTTLVARRPCDFMILTKDDLEEVFEGDPLAARRMCHAVLGDFLKDDKIRKMAAQMRVAMMPRSEVRAALHIQYAWKRYYDVMTQANDPVYALIKKKEVVSRQERWQSRRKSVMHPGSSSRQLVGGSSRQSADDRTSAQESRNTALSFRRGRPQRESSFNARSRATSGDTRSPSHDFPSPRVERDSALAANVEALMSLTKDLAQRMTVMQASIDKLSGGAPPSASNASAMAYSPILPGVAYAPGAAAGGASSHRAMRTDPLLES